MGSLPARVPPPAVHRVASLAKRWILGTHQGATEADHFQAYLEEFPFRFNRRKSDARGMLFFRLLEGAVATKPLTYARLVANPQSKAITPVPPAARRVAPDSLVRAVLA